MLSGLLLGLAFPKFGHGLVAWVALVPLLLALPGTSPRRAAGLGYLTGLVAGVVLLYWTALVAVQYGGLPLGLAGAVLLLLAAAVALFPALFAWSVARCCQGLGPAGLLLAPVAWVATETLRAYTFFRFPWCLLGYSQQAFPVMIQIADVTAVYGVSFVVVAPAAVAAYLRVEPLGHRRRRALAALALLLGVTLGYGVWRLREPSATDTGLRVGLVQADIRQEIKWDPTRALDNVARHVALTREAAARSARLVVWPESALPFLYDEAPMLRAELQALAAREGVYLFFGNDDVRRRGNSEQAFVGAKLLRPDGRLGLRYHKMRLVPFGEYVPLQPLLTLGGRVTAKLVQRVADFSPGESHVLGEVDGRRLSGLICYEVIFPDLAREFVARGAELLVNVTNDGWYGRTSAPHQHLMMAAFRAVENRRFLVRAANTGISAVIDPHGRIVARSALFEARALVEDVFFQRQVTFYSRFGDVFAFGCLLLAAGVSAAGPAVRFRRAGRPR